MMMMMMMMMMMALMVAAAYTDCNPLPSKIFRMPPLLSPSSVDDGNAEPLQHYRSSAPSHHNLPGLDGSWAKEACQARVEPRLPVPQRSPRHQQQRSAPPPPPSWASETLTGQGRGMSEEGRHQAKTGDKAPSSPPPLPPPASMSAGGRHLAAHHSSRPPLIPQHQAARPPAPKRPRSPEYQKLQQYQPHDRNPRQLPTPRPDEAMPPPAAPTAALPRSTGPNSGISDAPPPHHAPGTFATAADVPAPRGLVPPQPSSPRNPPHLSPPQDPRLMGAGSSIRTSGAILPLPLTLRSQQKSVAASLSPAQQLSSPCDDAALLSLGAPRRDASPLGRGDGASIPTVAEKAMKLTRKIGETCREPCRMRRGQWSYHSTIDFQQSHE